MVELTLVQLVVISSLESALEQGAMCLSEQGLETEEEWDEYAAELDTIIQVYIERCTKK